MNTVFMLMKCLVVATYNLILVPLGYNFFFPSCGLSGSRKRRGREQRDLKNARGVRLRMC